VLLLPVLAFVATLLALLLALLLLLLLLLQVVVVLSRLLSAPREPPDVFHVGGGQHRWPAAPSR
jgi:hypothetical protein